MALVSLRQILDYAAEHNFAVPAFNISNMEHVQAIMQAADACDSPVIMQGSAGANNYAGEIFLRHLILAAIEQYPHIPVVMHRDHGPTPDICAQAIQSGFSSVMMDGSLLADMKTPASFEYNVEVTSAVVKMAHACGGNNDTTPAPTTLGLASAAPGAMNPLLCGRGLQGQQKRKLIQRRPKRRDTAAQCNHNAKKAYAHAHH